MKKKMSISFLALGLLIAACTQAFAGGPNDPSPSDGPTPFPIPTTVTLPVPDSTVHFQSLPVSSLETLWVYAFNQIRSGEEDMSGSTILYSPGSQTLTTFNYEPDASGVPDPAEIGNLILSGFHFNFDVNRTDVPLTLSAYLMDYKGRQLFQGSENVNLYTTPMGNVTYTPDQLHLKIADVIYIPYAGARWATFVERDEYGNIITYHSIPVVNGEIAFPVGLITSLRVLPYAGYDVDSVKKHGEIKVTVADPVSGNLTEHAYSVDNNGAYLAPQHVGGGKASIQIGGIISYPTDVAKVGFDVDESSPQFVGRVKYTHDTQVSIHPSTGSTIPTEFFHQSHVVTQANHGKILAADGSVLVGNFYTTEENPFQINLSAGVFFIILDEWNDPSFGIYNRDQNPAPADDGGKG